MLPFIYQQHYQSLKQTFEQLQQDLATATVNLDAAIARFLAVQTLCQQQGHELDPDLLDPELQGRVRSCQTEINKEFRLLKTDLAFLQAARQAQTQAQRGHQIRDRLQRLIDYCQILLEQA